MLSKNTIKLVKSLQIKKYRQEQQLFLVEGRKSVLELAQSNYEIKSIFCTTEFHEDHLKKSRLKYENLELVTDSELSIMGSFETNNSVIALIKIPSILPNLIFTGKTLMLDGVQDPGNMGTIIRTADWFGIKQIVCSKNCVELYNPKVISATKGSFTRVQIVYSELQNSILEFKKEGFAIYGAYMNGENLKNVAFSAKSLIIMGNESHGISEKITTLVDKKITIEGKGNTESLNVGIATAIILHQAF